jgi:hypothetical protein
VIPFSAATDRLGRSEQFPRQQATPLHLAWRAITSGVGTRNEPAGEDENHRIGGGFGEKGADVGWFNRNGSACEWKGWSCGSGKKGHVMVKESNKNVKQNNPRLLRTHGKQSLDTVISQRNTNQ